MQDDLPERLESLREAYEAERAAIARELHDGPVQLLTAASLRLQSAVSRGNLSAETAQRVSTQIDEAAAALRRLMAALGGSSETVARPSVPAVDESNEPPTAAGSILVVDDEPVVLELINDILEAEGYEVRTARDGAEALALCRAKGNDVFDLLLTDFALPGLSGPALAAEITALSPGTAVLCTSGYAANAATELPSGAAFLQKPFTSEELIATVQGLLAPRSRG